MYKQSVSKPINRLLRRFGSNIQINPSWAVKPGIGIPEILIWDQGEQMYLLKLKDKSLTSGIDSIVNVSDLHPTATVKSKHTMFDNYHNVTF